MATATAAAAAAAAANEETNSRLSLSLSLAQVYRDLAQRATDDAESSWPASDGFVQFMDWQHNEEAYKTPTFLPDQGPVGMFAFFSSNRECNDNNYKHNPQAVPLIEACLQQFDNFCNHVLPPYLPAEPSDKTLATTTTTKPLIVESKVPHITVAVFQEHVRMLSPEHTKTTCWEPISKSKIQELIRTLLPLKHHSLRYDDFRNPTGITTKVEPPCDKKDHHTNKSKFSAPLTSSQEALTAAPQEMLLSTSFPAIDLELDSILWTADGALIAGFVEHHGKNLNLFCNLRQTLIQQATHVLGSVTSRPKNLIHVTLGRIVGFVTPSTTTQTQQRQDMGGSGRHNHPHPTALRKLIKEWNDVEWPKIVQELRKRHNGGIIRLTDVTLHRNTVWLCEQGEYLATWILADPDAATATGTINPPSTEKPTLS